jgi:hypothetical protein
MLSMWAGQAGIQTLFGPVPCEFILHFMMCQPKWHADGLFSSAALYNMMVQLSRVVYSNIYREDDEPEYRRGNRVLIGICSANLCIYALIKVYYVWKNRSREKKWQSWTPEVSRLIVLLACVCC